MERADYGDDGAFHCDGSVEHVFPGRTSHCGLEIFAEKRGVGEVQQVADFLHSVSPAF